MRISSLHMERHHVPLESLIGEVTILSLLPNNPAKYDTFFVIIL
jgi:hypothetical protein